MRVLLRIDKLLIIDQDSNKRPTITRLESTAGGDTVLCVDSVVSQKILSPIKLDLNECQLSNRRLRRVTLRNRRMKGHCITLH